MPASRRTSRRFTGHCRPARSPCAPATSTAIVSIPPSPALPPGCHDPTARTAGISPICLASKCGFKYSCSRERWDEHEEAGTRASKEADVSAPCAEDIWRSQEIDARQGRLGNRRWRAEDQDGHRLTIVHRYRLYGLTLSSSLRLPCLPAPLSAHPDVSLGAGSAPRFARLASSHQRTASWFTHRTLPDGVTHVGWTGHFDFLISRDGRCIHYRRGPHGTLESRPVSPLGQFLSFSMPAFGREPLHGTVSVVDGVAVAFLGDCGYGKSTLGAAFLERGCPVVTDDVVVLEREQGSWAVHPGMPRLKLFPAIARQFFTLNQDGAPMNQGTSKRVLPLREGQSVSSPVRLRAIYVLSPPVVSNRRPDHITIERLA